MWQRKKSESPSRIDEPPRRNPLYGLYGNVPLDRVSFLVSLPWTGYTILCEPVLSKQGMLKKKLVLKNRVLKKIVFKKVVIGNKTLLNCVKRGSVYFLLCPERGCCPTQGVYFFVLNRVRVWNPQRHPYTQPGQVPPPTGWTNHSLPIAGRRLYQLSSRELVGEQGHVLAKFI